MSRRSVGAVKEAGAASRVPGKSRAYPRLGMACVAVLVGVGLFGPLVANNEPIACRHAGRWHFPAVIEVLHRLPGGARLISKSAPFGRPGWNAKRELTPDAPALWPPIRFGPEEISAEVLRPPSRRHWLGTDDVGRDVASRLAHGAAVSLQVAFGSMLIAGVIGAVVGAAAGYWGGWIDAFLSRLIEVVMCFPVLFLVLGLMVWLEPSALHLVLVIGLTRWTSFARYVRAEFIRRKTEDFVAAARASGASAARIVFRHLLPNCLTPFLVAMSFGLANALLIETGLSWLGFGIPAPQASWGQMLRGAFEHLRTAPHLIYPPCIALFVAVLGFNLLGDAVRNAADPRWAGRLGGGGRPEMR